MKLFQILFFCLTLSITASFTNLRTEDRDKVTWGIHGSDSEEAVAVLRKTSERLNAIQELSYSYGRSVNYVSESFHNEIEGAVYLKYEASSPEAGIRFQVENEQTKIVYNGSEYFFMDKASHTIDLKVGSQVGSFENFSFFYNSLPTFRNALPRIIEDTSIQKSLADTTIHGKTYYLASFTLENKTLTGLGEFSTITLQRKFLYRLILDKESYLPLQVIQSNNVELQDYVRTTFEDIRESGSEPSELSWYYSSYPDYQRVQKESLTPVEVGQAAPKFKLPFAGGLEEFSLTEAGTDLVLLEFWIKNCGYCIQAVPKLNELAEKYANRSFQVLGVNNQDEPSEIEAFYLRQKPGFRTLLDLEGRVTRSFGIDAFPQVVLLNRNGQVLYSGLLDIEAIESLLEAHLAAD